MKKRLMFLIALVFVSLVAFSSATYAWFSKQYNPKVNNFNFNLATQEYMMISKSGLAGTFEDDISFDELVGENVTLRPVSAQISENNISLFDGENPSSTDNYIKFSLYFSGSNDMDVYLAGSTSGTVVDVIKIQNSIFTDEQINKMVDSLRIGFLAYTTREVPTSSGLKINYDPIFTNVYSVNNKTNASYEGGLMPYETFTNIGHTEGILDDVVLLNTNANKIHKLDVFVWLEDKDVNCNESIFNTKLQVNLRFLAVKNEGDGN